MKIIYAQNPLYTTVELDDYEKRELWYKIKLEQLEDDLFTTNFYLTQPDFKNLEKAKECCNFKKYYTENGEKISKTDFYCNHYLDYYLEALQSFHLGDCICVASSCPKCQAERLLGIDTIPNLDKYAGHHIDQAFRECNNMSIEQALFNLLHKKFVKGDSWKNYSQEDFEKHIPRWSNEAKKAYEWLLNYKKTKLN